jgi:hypothetical protein
MKDESTCLCSGETYQTYFTWTQVWREGKRERGQEGIERGGNRERRKRDKGRGSEEKQRAGGKEKEEERQR